MKVLLVYPFNLLDSKGRKDEPRIPLSITYIGAAARKAGHDVTLLDLRVKQQKMTNYLPQDFDSADLSILLELLEKQIEQKKTQMVGINCLFSAVFPSVIRIAKFIKKVNPKIDVIIGGIHPTLFTEQIMEKYSDCIDYVSIGESENQFVQLLNALDKSGVDTPDYIALSKIEGIAYNENGKLKINPKRNYLENLDELDFPAVDLLNMEDYFIDTSGWHSPKGINIKTAVPITTSRSCPKMCNFCSMHLLHGKRIRYRSPQNVIKELEFYAGKYGLRYFNFTDDNLTLNKKRTIELMDLIVKSGLNISFSTENGVYINSLDEEVLDAMSAAGLARLHLAFETGSDYIRNEVIGKNLYNTKINELAEILSLPKYNHIYLNGYFLLGLPEETEETLNETFDLIKSFPLDDYSLFYATPFLGTKLYEQCFNEGLFTKDYFYDKAKMVEQTDVGMLIMSDPHIKPYNLSVETLIKYRDIMQEHLTKIRTESGLPRSSPLRYRP